MRRDRGATVLVLNGEFDLDTVSPVASALNRAAADEGPVIVDLHGVTFADSMMVNALVRAHRMLGSRLSLAAPSSSVRRLIEIVGLDGAIPVHRSVDDALAAGPSVPPRYPTGDA